MELLLLLHLALELLDYLALLQIIQASPLDRIRQHLEPVSTHLPFVHRNLHLRCPQDLIVLINSIVRRCALFTGTGGFGTASGSLFGQQQPPQQTASLFKPFGQATTTQTTGFSFGNTSTLGQPNTSSMVSFHWNH